MPEIEYDENAAIDAIAIVGMALRVPGAVNLAQFWDNLKRGVESTTHFDDAQLREAGIPEKTLKDPAYVKAFGRLASADFFDAGFFDLAPREAEILDPQHRQLLECGWEALEHAGYAPRSEAMAASGRVGVFAGVGLNAYLIHQLMGRNDLIETLGGWQVILGNDKDFAVTRLAYKLDLRGPAISVSTACSTSLVGVGMGCQSLLSYQSDMVLAGGCSIHLPQDQGYWYHPGGTLSPDGRCRAFDAQAQGTFDANGVAMVVLKRLDDALRDGDTVHAVIRGFAINNDGAEKVGYTAPGVAGQAAAIREAQAMADVDAASIGYVETHGTGTDLGDMVEIAALKEAFAGVAVGQCAIGSLKTNVGHLDTAAGTASLIKVVLGMQQKQIPPTLHFTAPNPKLELTTSPFHVNATTIDWPRRQNAPRRAGVSSFGIGGTNAHVVVEEAPADTQAANTPCRPWLVLPLSARSADALGAGKQRLAEHLQANPNIVLADAAATLQQGRRSFRERQALVVRNAAEASAMLTGANSQRSFRGAVDSAPDVVLMFPGQDAQFAGMAQTLYRDEPLFRETVDHCAAVLRERHGIELSPGMLSADGGADPAFAGDPLPLFILEVAIARMWLALGVRPRAMIGYSLGEYTCAYLADVFSLEDALALAVAGRSLQSYVRPGALLGVALGEDELRPLLGAELDIAMIMAPRQCVVGGPVAAVQALEKQLAARGIACLNSQLGLPFHTRSVDPFLVPYREALAKVRFNPPRIPYVSCVTGDWVTKEQATDPQHYLDLARQAVRMSQGLERVLALPNTLLLEAGPSQIIASLVFLQSKRSAEQAVVTSQCDPRFQNADAVNAAFASALGKLWVAGVDLQWSMLYATEKRKRVPLPTYAFEQQRYWVEAASTQTTSTGAVATTMAGRQADPAQWFHLSLWRELPPLPGVASVQGQWLIVGARTGLATTLASGLRAAGAQVTLAYSDGAAEGVAGIDCLSTVSWDALLEARIAAGQRPTQLVYFGLLDACATSKENDDEALLNAGFHSLLAFGQAFSKSWFAESLQLAVVASRVLGADTQAPLPAAAAMLGPLRVLPQEYPNLRCRVIDIGQAPVGGQTAPRQMATLLAELAAGSEAALALRQGRRWAESFVPHPLSSVSPTETQRHLRPRGVYLITGGLGNIGLALARRIAQRSPGARLLLTGRGGLPTAAGDARQRSRQQAVKDLIALGAEVRVAAADVTDAAAMAAAIADAEQAWGPVNGVIHAAGHVGQSSFATVKESTRDFCATQLAPKLGGARVLETVLGERPLDFCLLCSSLSPILGGLGFAAYAAGNAALDAFAAAHNAVHGTGWLTVNWEGWQFPDDTLPAGAAAAAVEELALNADDGSDAFERILAAPTLERIVISTANLDQRIRQWVAFDTPPAEATVAARHARPSLLGAYVAPAGATALAVAELWERLLGIDGIGAEDSFFELGGNSLLLTQLLAQIRKQFRLELSLTSLFESATIAAIAQLVDVTREALVLAEGERDEGEL